MTMLFAVWIFVFAVEFVFAYALLFCFVCCMALLVRVFAVVCACSSRLFLGVCVSLLIV